MAEEVRLRMGPLLAATHQGVAEPGLELWSVPPSLVVQRAVG